MSTTVLHSGGRPDNRSTGIRWSASLAGGVAAVLIISAAASNAVLDQLTLWLIQSILALSLVVVWGRGGIFSLGQSALYGMGAYAFGVAAVNLADTVFMPWALLCAVVIAALTAGVIGYFIFYGRVSQLSVAIITLAFTMVAYAVLNSLADPKYAIGGAVLGGYNGMVGIPMPRLGGAQSAMLGPQQIFVAVGLSVVALTALVSLLLRSPFGRLNAAIRDNESRAELLGIDVRKYRLLLFVFGGALAGLGGGMYAGWSSFVSPELFSLQPAILVIIWVLVGGRVHLLGAIVGTLVVEGLTSWLGGSQGQYAPIYLGIALIGVVLFAPAGLLGTVQSLWRNGRKKDVSAAKAPTARLNFAAQEARVGAASAPVRGDDTSGLAAGDTLVVSGLRKTFGGFHALSGVDLGFAPRMVHCIIGPNGAGKSTFFAALVGIIRPTAGDIFLGDQRLNRVAMFRRARLGIGIKLQAASVFPDLSTQENLWIAAYSRYADAERADRAAAELLHTFGLAADASTPAGTLAHGKQQWLEIAMVAAREPRIILLDEPTAGMSVEETRQTAALVKALAAKATVIVIEHDMAFVRELDAPTSVLHLGRLLITGTIADIQASDEVRRVYLGEEAHAQA